MMPDFGGVVALAIIGIASIIGLIIFLGFKFIQFIF